MCVPICTQDSIALKSEVHFPNVQFETMEVNPFVCMYMFALHLLKY